MLHTPRAYRGMVTSPHHLASQAGIAVLQDGGNAIEAAVAAAACLAVVYPHMTGIGGDSFWLVREPSGAVWCVSACGAAALGAEQNIYAGLDAIPWRGALAANTVAGTISGWESVLRQSGGGLPLERLLRDAIYYAEHGVAVTRSGAETALAKDAELRDVPGYAQTFRPHGEALREGQRLCQPSLANTLRRIAQHGCADFYSGTLAADIAADLAAVGSPVSAADLAAHRPVMGPPLTASLQNNTRLFNLPPPTQGLSSLLILSLFDRLDVREPDGFAHVHGLVESTKVAFACARAFNLGDPDFMQRDPQALLNDGAALNTMAAGIDRNRAAPWGEPTEPGDTTWFAAADGEGRMVSAIQSIFFEFGSGVVLPQTGIVWQNRGSSFRLARSGWNTLAPRRRPFHTLNPAMAQFEDGKVMAYGAMGGEGQPQTQAAIFTRHAIFGAGLQEAIMAPRWLLGRTWGEPSVSLKVESRLGEDVCAALNRAGHDLEVVAPFSATMGHAGALMRHADGLIEGASDPRSDGAVAAW